MQKVDYDLLSSQIISLSEGVEDEIANFSNFSALINSYLEDVNWVGFYFVKNSKLVLGPFQGQIACTYISFDKGVCGYCYRENKTVKVDNVHEFPGHIACDSRSNSEVVIPIHKDNEIYALLDIDSTSLSRFSNEDVKGLEKVVNAIEKVLNR